MESRRVFFVAHLDGWKVDSWDTFHSLWLSRQFIFATFPAGWKFCQKVVNSKGILPKMAETFRLRIHNTLPRNSPWLDFVDGFKTCFSRRVFYRPTNFTCVTLPACSVVLLTVWVGAWGCGAQDMFSICSAFFWTQALQKRSGLVYIHTPWTFIKPEKLLEIYGSKKTAISLSFIHWL